MNGATIRALWKREAVGKGGFVRNWAYLLSSSVFGQVLGMLALIRVARLLAPAGYGYFNLVQTTAGIGVIIAGFGMRNTIIRDCSRAPERAGELFGAGLWSRLLFGIVAGAGIVTYSAFRPTTLPFILSGLAVLLLFSQIVWDTAESVSFGCQRMELSAWINSAGSVAWVLWVWCAPAALLTIIGICLPFVVIQMLKAGALLPALRRIAPSVGQPLGAAIVGGARKLIVASLPFYWLALMTMIQNQMPVLVLAERSDPAQVGLFNVGFRLLSPFNLLIMTGLSALYPFLSKVRVLDTSKYMQAIDWSLRLIAILGSGAAFLISLFRRDLIGILFGRAYYGAADAMAFQCWYLMLFALLCLIGTSLAACDKQRWLAVLTTAYTIVVLPLIWFGAARGASGLAVAMALGASINMIYHWIAFRRSLPGRLAPGVVIRMVAVIGFAFIASRLVPADAALGVKAAIAALALIAIGTVTWGLWEKARRLR